MSFNRLHHSLVGYDGPTILVIKPARSSTSKSGNGNDSDAIFGAFTTTRWKDSNDFFGGGSPSTTTQKDDEQPHFLFQLSPEFRILPPTKSSTHSSTGGSSTHHGNGSTGAGRFVYCNSSQLKKAPPKGDVHASQVRHGIGFGGTLTQPRLFITERFGFGLHTHGVNVNDGRNQCQAHFRDSTYEHGELLSPQQTSGTSTFGVNNYKFEMETIQVWATGGTAKIQRGLEARDKYRSVADAHIRNNQRVDKAQFLDDFHNGFLESKAFGHRDQIRGRAEKSYEVDDHRK
jgi:hypothetical protein